MKKELDGCSGTWIVSKCLPFGSVTGARPTVYCYRFSDADAWANKCGLRAVYLDDYTGKSILALNIPTPLRVLAGTTLTNVLGIVPDYINSTITWTSSNPKVAVGFGRDITALSPGTVTLTATDESGISASCYVTVTGEGGYIMKDAVDLLSYLCGKRPFTDSVWDADNSGALDLADVTAIFSAIAGK